MGLVSSFSPRISLEKMRLEKISGELSKALAVLPDKNRDKLRRAASAIAMAAGRILHQGERELTFLEGQVEMRDPARMLELGWGVVKNAEGKTVKKANDLSSGEKISVTMLGGIVKAFVEEIEND